jgi:hypothetical protein
MPPTRYRGRGLRARLAGGGDAHKGDAHKVGGADGGGGPGGGAAAAGGGAGVADARARPECGAAVRARGGAGRGGRAARGRSAPAPPDLPYRALRLLPLPLRRPGEPLCAPSLCTPWICAPLAWHAPPPPWCCSPGRSSFYARTPQCWLQPDPPGALGQSYLDCGHPCESNTVHLSDPQGNDHLVLADMGCRNTVFNARAQSGAFYLDDLREAGYRSFRVELVDEHGGQVRRPALPLALSLSPPSLSPPSLSLTHSSSSLKLLSLSPSLSVSLRLSHPLSGREAPHARGPGEGGR